MSAGIYANVNGVTRKGKKLYAKVNGVVRPIKELWVKVNGVARCVYKNAITWTYEASSGDEYASSDMISSYYSALYAGHLSSRSGAYGTAVNYVFNNNSGFIIHAGQTIRLLLDPDGFNNTYSYGDVYINGSDSPILSTYDTKSHGIDVDETYTFTSDTRIRTIRAYVSGRTFDSDGVSVVASIKVTVNSDYGSFLLNNSGKSN